MKRKSLLFFACQLAWFTPFAQQVKKPLSWQDIPSWQYIRTGSSQPSSDGQWFAYVSGPSQGDLTLSLRKTQDSTNFNYKIGGINSPITFNNNNQFVAFYESPNFKEVKANEKARKPSSKKLKIVALKDTASLTFDKVQGFNFSNDDNKWIAIRFEGAIAPGPKSEDAAKGNDLLLYNLITKKSYNLGNVSDYKFNKSGQYLAYIVDANGKNGNGIFIMDLSTGLTNALQNDKANYSKITWNKEGTAFSLLKANKNKDYKTPVYSLIGVKNIKGNHADLFTYSGLDENQISAGYGISENSTPFWSKDLNTIFFGIAKIEKTDDAKKKESKENNIEKDSTATKLPISKDSTAIAKTKAPQPKALVNKKDLEKPDMIIWNWQDKRLQSAQKNQFQRDKNHTIMSAWNIPSNSFNSLADSTVKSIGLAPNQQIGYGYDFTPYEYMANLDGQAFADIYIIDIKTGKRRLALEKHYLNATRSLSFSPNSQYLLYYQDGNYYTLDVNTLAKNNLTANIPASFVDIFDDHNVSKVATRNFGWTLDSKYILLKDNFDLWKVSNDGKNIVQLTPNWKDQEMTPRYYSRIYEDDEGIDLKKDQYFNIFNNKTKQEGLAILPMNKNKLEVLKLDDISMGSFQKVKNADKFFYSLENSNQAPDIFFSDKLLKSEQKLTTNTPDSLKNSLSAGSKLITYVSAHGDTLQATLYLPADYVEGKSYPTITYIYERLTDEKNSFSQPAYPGGGFNRAMYTNNGYAVLMPDIKYKLNDPGMSAVACVIPAVQAAIATGVVDKNNVAIHGHSWGGYQTSFLITQTDIFKAAVAGAPLTNMISMYSLIYWNSGGSNQSIFESSQGRLTTGYWDNWDAYTRNSPIYHIKKVNTPLIIMHNDKDGAVDYTQGVEYYNGLRRLNKPVVMLTYNGENHGLMKEVNRKDYAVRMMEYFDHYLKGKPAPTWWSKGVDYMDMEKHLEERAF